MSHTDPPGCHGHEVDPDVKLFTREAPGSNGCLISDEQQVCRHPWALIQWAALLEGGPCGLAGLGHRDWGAGSSGFSGAGRRGGCLVLGLDSDTLTGAGGCRAGVPERRLGASGFRVTVWWTFPGRSVGRGLNGTPVQILPLVSGGAPSLRMWVRHLLDPGTSSGDTVGARRIVPAQLLGWRALTVVS